MKRFQNILYVVEESVNQDTAIACAVSLARDNQASLTVLDVVPEPQLSRHVLSAFFPEGIRSRLIVSQQKKLAGWVAPYREQLPIRAEVVQGRQFLEVIRAVLREGYDLVIKPAENPEWLERLFGGDDMHLLRKCPCPVWMMKPNDRGRYRNVVVAVDFDPNDLESEEFEFSLDLLDIAGSVAVAEFAQLHLVHAWEAPEAGFISAWLDDPEKAELQLLNGERERHRTGVEALVQALRERIGVEGYQYLAPRVHLLMDQARKAIPAAIRDLNADLLVMGTVARTGIPGLIMGNTAEMVLNQVHCSVLAIKPPGFVSPVTL
ncbi:MAG: universal stress protein [Marinobacter sp.]|uniref:universal stress protein n=1 Tax=Marinobacter sp. TaxID=50741 RepID=UPI00299E83B4|nr:universal stress protein [Marinobacter sp.]MDX1757059.1 universal stress protein [Marinobacter sp.]